MRLILLTIISKATMNATGKLRIDKPPAEPSMENKYEYSPEKPVIRKNCSIIRKPMKTIRPNVVMFLYWYRSSLVSRRYFIIRLQNARMRYTVTQRGIIQLPLQLPRKYVSVMIPDPWTMIP